MIINEFFTSSTALKFVEVLNIPPLLIIKDTDRISNPTMEEIDATNPKYIAAIASVMVSVHASILEKPSPWHPFIHLLDKWYLHCIENR